MKGFTLVEVLLSIALVSIIAGFSVPFFNSFLYRSEVENATTLTITSIRSANILARSQKNDSNWGVYLSGNSVTIYSGNDYVSRDVTLDQVYSFDGVSFSGNNEVNFVKFSGIPNTSATINVNGEVNSDVITINSLGIVDY